MLADFPPSSNVSGVSVSAAAAITRRAVAQPPVNDTLSTPGWRTSASPAAAPPTTTFSTPGGSPASSASSANRSAPNGASSGRLDHDGVAGRQRRHRLLAHAHHRTVPRHDGADDPVGLGEHDVEDVARDRHDLAVELVDPARVVPGPGGGVLTRAHRAHRRAVVERVDRARLVVVRLEQVGEAVEDRHPLGHGDGPPLVPRSTRHRDRGVDLGRPGQRQLRLQHTGGGVVVLVDATRVARRPLPADHVAARRELFDQRGGGGGVERHQPPGRRRARRLATIGGA